MLKMRLTLYCSALFLVAGLAAGCGDDPAAGGNGDEDTGGPDAGPDTGPDTGTPDTPANLTNRLILVTEPEPSVSFNERVPVQVRYVDPDGTPLADEFIAFEPLQDTGDSRLSARNALTDAEGVAETFIEAGIQQVDFDIVISVPSDDAVDSVTVSVSVQPKDASDYIIQVNYEGPLTLHRVEVLLFDTDRACDTLVEDPHESPSDDVAWTSLIILPAADNTIPDRGLNAPNAVEFHYAIARAEPSDGEGGGQGYFGTFGCQDVIPPADPAESTVIEIDMHNLWPEVEGTYRLTNNMELLDIIPDDFQPLVESIGEFFNNPGLGLLRIVALTVGGDLYYTEEPWSLLFNCTGGEDPVTGECFGDVVASSFGTAAAGILESVVNLGIDALPENVGGTIDTILTAGSDIFDNAESFTLSGDLIIAQNPDSSGLLGDLNSVRFNQITWLWTNDEDEQVERTITLRNESIMRGEEISAAVMFHPEVDAEYALAIEPFDLSLNYGEMLIWVLEGIIFPELIGDDVDSFEDFFTYLVDCEDVAEQVEMSDFSLAADAIELACETLQATAVTALEEWLSSLTLDLGTYYYMGTPADDPCIMNFPPNDSDFRVQSLGGPELNNRCVWEGAIRFDSDDTEPEDLDGNWWGDRL